MSVELFAARVRGTALSPTDQQWFLAWIRRYAEAVKAEQGSLPITREFVIEFLRDLRSRSTPAWQRLQATRAIEAYNTLVLDTDQPFAGRPQCPESARRSGADRRTQECRHRQQ